MFFKNVRDGHVQKPKWIDENTFEIRFELIINYELESLILSYADSVTVIEPSNLPSAIKKRLTTALKNNKIVDI